MFTQEHTRTFGMVQVVCSLRTVTYILLIFVMGTNKYVQPNATHLKGHLVTKLYVTEDCKQEHLMWTWYFLGIFSQRQPWLAWVERHQKLIRCGLESRSFCWRV